MATGDIMTATPALWRDLLLFADFAGKVQAVDARDGKPRWSYDARLAVAGDLVVDAAGRVFVGSRTYDLIALDAATGKELWKHYYWFSWIESPPVVRGQTVYTGSSDGVGVYAIDVATGARRWKARVPGWAWARTAVDDRLVVAGTVGYGAWPGVRSGSLVGIDRQSGALALDACRSADARAGGAEGGMGLRRRAGAGRRHRLRRRSRRPRVRDRRRVATGYFRITERRERPHHHAAAATSRRTG